MAIYHLSAKIISRSAGRSVVNAAAYRRGVSMVDERTASSFSYARKQDVMHSELTVPRGAPAWAQELVRLHEREPVRASELLWNRVEQHEKRGDAQLAREVELALPVELTFEQHKALLREFIGEQLVARGMIADWSVHQGKDQNPHAHILLTMRPLAEAGFGARKAAVIDPATGQALRDERGKIRYAFGDPWGSKQDLKDLRERWAEYQNVHLAQHAHDVRVDHRSFAEQGIELTPTSHVGVHAQGMETRGKPSARVVDLEEERRENAAKIAQRPEHVFDVLTRRQAVFTWTDVEKTTARYLKDPEEVRRVLARLEVSPERVELAPEERTEAGWIVRQGRYSTRSMLEAEQRMVETSESLAGTGSHPVEAGHVATAFAGHPQLSQEQQAAVLHITASSGITAVAGFAGAGKSTTLAAAREIWEAQGYRVRGAALAGKAADGLRETAGIESRTIHSLELAWKRGRETVGPRDVLVIDEAGMVGSLQLGRVLDQVQRAGAKVVLVGDARQLQPIEAGAPFRAITERVGVAEISTIRRQHDAWAREASQAFAAGDVRGGLAAYGERGHVQVLDSRDEAKAALVRGWASERQGGGRDAVLILAHTNEDVHDLNERVRRVRRAAGELGPDTAFATGKGVRSFAAGDRIVFLENDRGLGVKNGTLGTVLSTVPGRLSIQVDSGARVEVDETAYASVDHGYAVTIHKAQGVTVDRAHVLASGGMDRHLAYVAMTRHREQVTLYAGRDDFSDHRALATRLGRARPKETTLDFAERRGMDTPLSFIENARAWVERGRERLAEIWQRAERAMTAIRSRPDPGQGRPEAQLRNASDPASPGRQSGSEGRDTPPGAAATEQRLAEGGRLEAAWGAKVARELEAVRSRATRLGQKLDERVCAAAERLGEHMERRPELPGGLAQALGGRSRYERDLEGWTVERVSLSRRHEQLRRRAEFVREYAAEPNRGGLPTKGQSLAERNVGRREPETFMQVLEYRSWQRQEERVARRERAAERDRGIGLEIDR